MLLAEKPPCLSDRCAPPAVLGTAALTTAAMQGALVDTLAEMIATADRDPVARLYDTAIAWQLDFRRAEGLGVQNQALAASRLFRVQHPARDSIGQVRVLAVCIAGDMMANTPLDFITNHLPVRLDLLFVGADGRVPAVLPDHDVAFFAASETDAAQGAQLQRLYAGWPRPALNDPAHLPALRRDVLAGSLADVADICSPSLVLVDRPRLEAVVEGRLALHQVLPGCGYPVLLRPAGSHAGVGLKKIDSLAELAASLTFAFEPEYYLSRFVDYRSSDGLYRKYRIAFIDRVPYLSHMAASGHWMVHYLNAGMTESAAKRAEEAQSMAQFEQGFAYRHRHAFAALHQRIGFDYYSIDCAETPDGRLLVFEADTAAIVHAMDPVEMFAYKQAPMRHLFDAFYAMLRRRMTGT